MAEIALQALYKGVQTALTSAGGVFDHRVRVSMVKAGTAYPYAIQFWQGGGEVNSIIGDDAEFMLGVKCVSDKLAEAMQGAATIHDTLNNKGEQGDPDLFVYGGADWIILTITEEETIYIAETTADSELVYHVGGSYRCAMVRR